MQKKLYILFLVITITLFAQKDESYSGIKLYDTSEKLVPLRNLLLQLENVVNKEKLCQNYREECQMFI